MTEIAKNQMLASVIGVPGLCFLLVGFLIPMEWIYWLPGKEITSVILGMVLLLIANYFLSKAHAIKKQQHQQAGKK